MAASRLDYWASQADFQIKTVNAWLDLAEKRKDKALRLMRAAAQAEEASDKHPVTPGNVAPSRELLAEMLLELRRPAEAFAEFERSLKRDRNRFRSIAGAARAAEAAGKREGARDYYARLQLISADQDSERPELVRARGADWKQ
jgi:predicted Zn-dependent protease